MTIQKLPETFSLSNGSSTLLSASGRDHSNPPEIGERGKERLSFSETPLDKTTLSTDIEPTKLINFSDETFILNEIDKLARRGLFGAAQGITGRENMAMILA